MNKVINNLIKILIGAILGYFLYGCGENYISNNKKWNEDGLREIVDIGDELTTYTVSNEDETNHLYNAFGGPIEKINIANNNTIRIGASIGIFTIKGSKSDSPYMTATEINGSITNSIAIKFPSARRTKNIPMYRMYVANDGGEIVLRIDYQADYEGDIFKVRFGEEKYIFVAKFGSKHTYSNPVKLVYSHAIESP